MNMNLCSEPPWVIASRHFNRHPKPLSIQGVRSTYRDFFSRLNAMDDPYARAQQFHDYLDVTFQLHQWQEQSTVRGRKSLKNSYLRFLRGWMFDSNSLEGAVLKGWVESRMGLPPTYHHRPIEDIHSEAYAVYLRDRMKGAARTSAINAQLDLLYEWVQYELARRHPDEPTVTLYRGVHDFAEHSVIEELGNRRYILRLNNLNSFTTDFERAWEFGSQVLKSQVPVAKIFFKSDFFPSSLLKGEEEVMVVGGEFDVDVLIGG